MYRQAFMSCKMEKGSLWCFNNAKRRFSHSKTRVLSLEDVKQNWFDIVSNPLASKGYVVLDMDCQSSVVLTGISKMCGYIQHNRTSGAKGYTEIVDEKSSITERGVVSSIAFDPHTDGVYLNGALMSHSGSLQKVIPPKLVLLQCLVQAKEGGEQILVDGGSILEELLCNNSNKYVQDLFGRNYGFYHDGVLIAEQSIFSMNSAGIISIRYSHDEESFCEQKVVNSILKLTEMLNQKKEVLKLHPNQILILDNTRILHARNSFCGERHLRRTWVQTDKLDQLYSIKTNAKQYKSKRASNTCQLKIHSPFITEYCDKEKYPLNLGIRLPEELKIKLATILKGSLEAWPTNEPKVITASNRLTLRGT